MNHIQESMRKTGRAEQRRTITVQDSAGSRVIPPSQQKNIMSTMPVPKMDFNSEDTPVHQIPLGTRMHRQPPILT